MLAIEIMNSTDAHVIITINTSKIFVITVSLDGSSSLSVQKDTNNAYVPVQIFRVEEFGNGVVAEKMKSRTYRRSLMLYTYKYIEQVGILLM